MGEPHLGAYGALQTAVLPRQRSAASAASAHRPDAAWSAANCNPTSTSHDRWHHVWTPVKNFALTLDVNWTQLDQKYSGTVFIQPSAGLAKPQATYELKDQGAAPCCGAQRNF